MSLQVLTIIVTPLFLHLLLAFQAFLSWVFLRRYGGYLTSSDLSLPKKVKYKQGITINTTGNENNNP